MTNENLHDLFARYGSDKGENGYAEVYEVLLRDRRDRVKHVFEIGIGTQKPGAPSSMYGHRTALGASFQIGGSLRAWRDYFPNAEIVGFDTQPDTQFEEERISTRLINSTRPFHAAEGFGADLVIDDGCHLPASQLLTLRTFWPLLRVGGLYVVEDVQNRVDTSAFDDAARDVAMGAPSFFVPRPKSYLYVLEKRPAK